MREKPIINNDGWFLEIFSRASTPSAAYNDGMPMPWDAPDRVLAWGVPASAVEGLGHLG